MRLPIITTARLAAGRWRMPIVLLCAAGVSAAEPTNAAPVVITKMPASATPTRRKPLVRLTCPERRSLPPGLTNLTNGQTVYWSVQAVDSAFAGGPFATETSVVSQPQLAITRPDASHAVVSWTPPTFGWVLQQSTNLSVSNWAAAPSGTANPATLPFTKGARFYRLSKP